MRVVGTVEIRFAVNIDAEDIGECAMPLNESEKMIKKAIEEKYDVTVTHRDVYVEDWR
ncbi:hypothetical protein Kirov_189 [Bacillus phage Kirov]|uniref:Uncharacterized protein n=1 Tax=Bacillus phage Kirov TaxID=2783539 RepID=A0A7U3NJZ1_9CAUD|nr:hypothetical protein PQE67_gp115 [Bacillus phage Kirov]QOV08388.1 hypothetical protein Kirov_189 [Bacillus phage Kirov]